jgi:2-polyprenyl-6-hydroxyphenyl methylase/3-demethylubiquinone-9 3-methyltransferase
MGLGGAVRRRLGRWEIPAADLYRSRFISLEDLASTLASLGPVKRIMEIGAGDGTFGQRICAVFPEADYVGIDIADNPGRLFQGNRERAKFFSMPTHDYLAANPGETFDLVVIVDVLHHVPEQIRIPLLRDAATLTAPGGMIAIKDWERGRGLWHLVAYSADRYLSGDKDVRFPSLDELHGFVAEGLPDFSITLEARIPPRRNNVLWTLRRKA